MRRALVVLLGLGLAVTLPSSEEPRPQITGHEFQPWTYKGHPADGLEPKTVCCYWQRGWLSMCDRPAAEHTQVPEPANDEGGGGS